MPAPQLRAACFTLNNPTPEAEARLTQLGNDLELVKYLVFGREKAPETGTPHLQGYVQFAKRPTFNKAKELLPAGAHIEAAKGSPQQNRTYCTKDGDFVEFGTPPVQGKRTDLHDVVDAIKSGERSAKRLREDFPGVCARHGSFVRQLLVDHQPKPATPDIVLKPWQSELYDMLRTPAKPRLVHFYVDTVGGAGKSTFATYVESLLENVQVLKPGRYSDLAYALDETVRILIFDCPRSREENIRYDFLEDVKDGRVLSSKYESYTKRLNPVHVIVFCNFEPDESKLSVDRFEITRI